ncbi:MAG TPA: endonuclease/exonuclease/phosphatase family protein [Candidatus Saccharimonadia bacterium]|nr:endonuclease/exonuclease/phosphatase family protein [Candidatus Saccharimonadia bacterium]
MNLKIGTFNLNNLFSRFNFEFRTEVPDLKEGSVEFKKVQKLVSGMNEASVEYEGVALKRKDPAARQAVVRRIEEMDLDILAVQEVEDIETLRFFVNHELDTKGMYPHLILVEGNDPRLIDLAVLSKYPIGAVTTWQHATHPDSPGERVFSRDLLQVEVLSKNRDKRLCTIFNNHLKSHFVRFPEDQTEGAKKANRRRQQQAEVMAKIIAKEMDSDDRFVVVGDMNDPVDSEFLKPFTHSPRVKLINGLEHPTETRPTPESSSPPPGPAWTHRFKESGKPAHYELFDQIWLSAALAKDQTGAFIDRRTKLGGDGSDHDPAWVEIAI